jgi:hypothetical protein
MREVMFRSLDASKTASDNVRTRFRYDELNLARREHLSSIVVLNWAVLNRGIEWTLCGDNALLKPIERVEVCGICGPNVNRIHKISVARCVIVTPSSQAEPRE